MIPIRKAQITDVLQDVHFQEKGVIVHLRREDLLHPEVSGNKWRKLKYNLIKAKETGHDTLLTFGGAYSNHLTAAAAAANLCGFKSIGLVRGEKIEPLNASLKFCLEKGMELHLISRSDFDLKNDKDFIADLRERFPRFYLIPEGGSNYLGINGCMEILNAQDVGYDFIACACGTTTMACGLLLSSGADQKVLVFSPFKQKGYALDMIQKNLDRYFLNNESAIDYLSRLEIVENFSLGGFAKRNEALFSYVKSFYKKHKIKLDPIYTSKMMFGLSQMIENDQFKRFGSILAIHSGGLQGWNGFPETEPLFQAHTINS